MSSPTGRRAAHLGEDVVCERSFCTFTKCFFVGPLVSWYVSSHQFHETGALPANGSMSPELTLLPQFQCPIEDKAVGIDLNVQ